MTEAEFRMSVQRQINAHIKEGERMAEEKRERLEQLRRDFMRQSAWLTAYGWNELRVADLRLTLDLWQQEARDE
jgi:hypothetical protein